MTLDRQRPEILTPPEHPPACCTQQTITVPPSVTAKTAQKHDYPSKAHRRSYARRTAAERTFSTAKDPASNDISRGWCRLMGLTAITLFTATLRIVRNQRIMDAWDARQAPWGALYHVDSRRLSALLITPRAIAAASCLAEVFHEDRYAPWDSVIAEDATAALPVWLRQSPVRPTAPARDEDYVGRPATETSPRSPGGPSGASAMSASRSSGGPRDGCSSIPTPSRPTSHSPPGRQAATSSKPHCCYWTRWWRRRAL